jgi:hypothetical protein
MLITHLDSDDNENLAVQGSIWQNSISAENFPDNFSTLDFPQISTNNNMYKFIMGFINNNLGFWGMYLKRP